MSEVLRTTRPRARKSHLCDYCLGRIRVGEVYRRQTFVWDDGPYDWVTCQQCEPLVLPVFNWISWPEEGVGSDDVIEWARENEGSDGEHGAMARAFLARRFPEPTEATS